MRAPEYTVCVPHYAVPHGRRTLRVCLDTLMDNADAHYELLVYGNSEGGDLYQIYNDLAQRASSEWLFLLMFDVYLPRHWDRAYLEARQPDLLLGCGVVEPGYEPVNPKCLRMDFGQAPETYRRASFEAWAMSAPAPTDWLWIFPWFVHRENFLDLGGFDRYSRDDGSWNMTDLRFTEKWQAAGGRVARANTWVYHMSRWSITGDKR